MTQVMIETHLGEAPADDEPPVCHLIDNSGALCGQPRPWGIAVDSDDAHRSPCSCGRERCRDCLDEATA